MRDTTPPWGLTVVGLGLTLWALLVAGPALARTGNVPAPPSASARAGLAGACPAARPQGARADPHAERPVR